MAVAGADALTLGLGSERWRAALGAARDAESMAVLGAALDEALVRAPSLGGRATASGGHAAPPAQRAAALRVVSALDEAQAGLRRAPAIAKVHGSWWPEALYGKEARLLHAIGPQARRFSSALLPLSWYERQTRARRDDAFALVNYSDLRAAVTVKSLVSHHEPLHNSLMGLTKADDVAHAVRLNEKILSVSGDRKTRMSAAHNMMAVHEIAWAGVDSGMLAETWAQALRHVTGNTSTTSMDLGWRVVAMLAVTCVPPDDLLPHVLHHLHELSDGAKGHAVVVRQVRAHGSFAVRALGRNRYLSGADGTAASAGRAPPVGQPRGLVVDKRDNTVFEAFANHDPLVVDVVLADGSVFAGGVPLFPTDTAATVLQIVAMATGLTASIDAWASDRSQWGLYERTLQGKTGAPTHARGPAGLTFVPDVYLAPDTQLHARYDDGTRGQLVLRRRRMPSAGASSTAATSAMSDVATAQALRVTCAQINADLACGLLEPMGDDNSVSDLMALSALVAGGGDAEFLNDAVEHTSNFKVYCPAARAGAAASLAAAATEVVRGTRATLWDADPSVLRQSLVTNVEDAPGLCASWFLVHVHDAAAVAAAAGSGGKDAASGAGAGPSEEPKPCVLGLASSGVVLLQASSDGALERAHHPWSRVTSVDAPARHHLHITVGEENISLTLLSHAAGTRRAAAAAVAQLADGLRDSP